MKFSLLIALLYLLPFTSFAQDENDVIVLQKGEWLPPAAKALGSIKVGGERRVNCGYDVSVKYLTIIAAKKGANVLVIKRVKLALDPLSNSNCLRIDADIYHLNDIQAYEESKKKRSDSIAKTFITGTEPYALIFIYQPAQNSVGRGTSPSREASPILTASYDLSTQCQVILDDMGLYDLRTHKKKLLQIDKAGTFKLGTNCYPDFDKQLNVKAGNIYFIHIDMGKKGLELVDADRAMAESAELNGLNNSY